MTYAPTPFDSKEFIKELKNNIKSSKNILGSVAFTIGDEGVSCSGSGSFKQEHAIAICMTIADLCNTDLVTIAMFSKMADDAMTPKGMCN